MNRSTLNYLLQRASAVLLLPLSLWLLLLVIPQLLGGIILHKLNQIEIFFSSLFNVVMLVLYIEIGLYHGFLGIHSIFKDYISCDLSRKLLIVLLIFVSLFCAFAGFIMIFDQHLLTLKQ
jgi:succinate dehydrogenase hydrophobic membrane anchor protein